MRYLVPASNYRGPGIYIATDETLQWHRRGLSSTEAHFEQGEVLIANGTISPEAKIPPGADVCVMESTGSTPVFDATTNRLTPEGEQIASGIISLFERIS